MKFTWKVFFSVIFVVVAAISVTSRIFISSSFDTALDQEKQKSFDRINMFAIVVESMLSGHSSLSGNDELITVMEAVATGDFQQTQLYDGEGIRVYPAALAPGAASADAALTEAAKNGTAHRILSTPGGRYVMEVLRPVQLGAATGYLYLTTDVSGPFTLCDEMTRISVISVLATVLTAGAVLFVISTMLTRPVRQLSATTRQFAEGDYAKRAAVTTHDEIGNLSKDFNAMADSLAAHMQLLADEARQRENFVSSFAHELKTPLTSIIGYADIIRSQRLDEEKLFACANYIFTEGRRLERLSLKLLELMVLNRTSFERYNVEIGVLAGRLSESTAAALREQYGVGFSMDLPEATVQVEPDLIQSMLINLVINAAKASQPGQTVKISGECGSDGYRVRIIDEGVGIPESELPYITEAFYMVDKSRSRAQSGSGLGLALCAAIARLHNTGLDFQTGVSRGTTVTFLLPYGQEDGYEA